MSGATDPVRRRLLRTLTVLAGGLLGASALRWWQAPSSPPDSTTTLRLASAGTSTTSSTATTAPATTTTTRQTTASTEPTTTTTAATVTASSGLQLLCREAWGAAPPAGGFTENRIRYLTVHHSAVVHDDPRQGPSRARAHQAYHQSLGWADLAYHFLVDRGGHVYEGRPVWAAGDTATAYDPTGHFLVCLEGHFDRQRPSDIQVRRAAELVAWGSATYGVGLDRLAGHRDYAATTCPGRRSTPCCAPGSWRRWWRQRGGRVPRSRRRCAEPRAGR